MYRLNPLMRDVLITTDEVIFHAPTKHTLDARTIQQSIIIAEERFIRPALGDDFYEELIGLKNTEVTSGNKSTLETQINDSLPTGADPILLNVGDIVNAMEFLSGDILTLWKTHLWKLTAECVLLLAVPEAFVQFGSEGVIHTVPTAGPMVSSGVVSPELRSVKWSMDKKLQDRIDPLMESMHSWLCRRKSNFLKYTKPCDCDSSGVAYKRKTDFIMGIYDDPENCDCP